MEKLCYCCLVVQLSLTLQLHGMLASQDPLFMEFPSQKYWSGLPFLSLEDLPDPGTEPSFTVPSALQVNSLPQEPPEKPKMSGMGFSGNTKRSVFGHQPEYNTYLLKD